VDQPNEEYAYAEGIQSLTSVTDVVSKAVRKQYEENPYPRWVGFSWRGPRPFREAIRGLLPHLEEGQLPLTDKPRVLIAGCGTGLETMRVVSSYETESVLAVDLSRAGLGYSMRKLTEYGVSGVEHKQADILELDHLDRRFDLITSSGVIHHLSEPQRGLNILTRLLEPGGFLFLGLYSAIARRPVISARKLIANRAVPSSPAGIRRLRRIIMMGEGERELSSLASPASDFWTMSECRDLMFHVKEHQFTLIQIGEMLDAVGLEFLGLQVPYAPDLRLFRQENRDPSDLRSLKAWHQFEGRHPQTFHGTYQLWTRKSG
jgi:ubiquinone/menaquinone biosynthesis C-methylase UbiE